MDGLIDRAGVMNRLNLAEPRYVRFPATVDEDLKDEAAKFTMTVSQYVRFIITNRKHVFEALEGKFISGGQGDAISWNS